MSARSSDTDPFKYDLVCGQGRIEAFVQLGQTEIPAMLIDAEESDCLVMSLVENCARRQHRAIDLLEDINTLRKRGYDDREIAEKIGVTQVGAETYGLARFLVTTGGLSPDRDVDVVGVGGMDTMAAALETKPGDV